MADRSIRYLTRREIDPEKWDRCIADAPRGLIYNTSFFLDHMAPGWEALVLDDYAAVMPLTWSKKYGIAYLYQPFCAAQTGITALETRDGMVDRFLDAIPRRFRLVDMLLQEDNMPDKYAGCCKSRLNLLLDLAPNHATLQAGYHRLARRMIERATGEGFVVETGAAIAESLAFYRRWYGDRIRVSDTDYQHLTRMFEQACDRGAALSLVVRKGDEILGMYALLYDDRAVYSVIGGSSPDGKEHGVFYLLTDHAIRHFAGTGRVFRFEGSDVPGIARFNQQFNSQPSQYAALRLNRLPFPLRLFKK